MYTIYKAPAQRAIRRLYRFVKTCKLQSAIVKLFNHRDYSTTALRCQSINYIYFMFWLANFPIIWNPHLFGVLYSARFSGPSGFDLHPASKHSKIDGKDGTEEMLIQWDYCIRHSRMSVRRSTLRRKLLCWLPVQLQPFSEPRESWRQLQRRWVRSDPEMREEL